MQGVVMEEFGRWEKLHRGAGKILLDVAQPQAVYKATVECASVAQARHLLKG